MTQLDVKSKAKDLLQQYNACQEAITWCGEQTVEEAWANCHRGDWMLWIYAKLYPNNIKEIALAKGHCANTVRHLMKDERSTKAVDAAIAFSNDEISLEELKIAAANADHAAANAAANVASAAFAAHAAAHVANVANAAANAANVASAAAANAAASAANAANAAANVASAAFAAHAAANAANRLKTASICRQYLKLT